MLDGPLRDPATGAGAVELPGALALEPAVVPEPGITVLDTARPSSETLCAQPEAGSDKASDAASTKAVLFKVVSNSVNEHLAGCRIRRRRSGTWFEITMRLTWPSNS